MQPTDLPNQECLYSKLVISKPSNKKRIVKNKSTIDKRSKQTLRRFAYLLVKDMPQIKLYHLFGDFFIDLDQLYDMETIKVVQPISFCKKTVSVVENKKTAVIEVTLQKGQSGMREFSGLIHILRSLNKSELQFLIEQLVYFQSLINQQKLLIDQDYNNIEYCESSDDHQKEIHQSSGDIEREIDSGWKFANSLNLAYKSIDKFQEECQNTNDFFVYTIHRGFKYEQLIEIVGYPKMVLEQFLCLNKEQIAFILLRHPFVTPKVLQSKYLDMFYSKTQAFTQQFSQNKSSVFPQNLQPILFKTEEPYDLMTIDNIKVSFKVEFYIQNLSAYKHKCSDQLFIMKYCPMGGHDPQTIIQNQRNLRSSLNQTQQNNPNNEDLSIFDIIYAAKSELFVDKFYNLMDSSEFHDLNQYIE